MKFYRGGARAARVYVEAGRVRADDYYLAEGSGLAARYSATGEGAVSRLADLAGDAYEVWVAGADPDTGVVRGRVRPDASGVRFCEVVVNGPKTWSLAAELHEDIAAAYESAQDGAAVQVIGWLASHVTTRVGPRGAQVATPVEKLEAVVVRHYTSRAGDPHRHLHVQVNSRVLTADGKWRGVDTVAVRQALGAVQGIGHAAVVCDPGFRRALAAHGYTLDRGSGEVVELAGLVPSVSRRTQQIAGLVAGYEAQWRQAHPGQVPGPKLRRVWDGRAWAEDRPAKVPAGGVEPGRVVHDRWITELRAAGFTAPAGPVELRAVPVGVVDRDAAAGEVLARLSAVRSAFNAADIRGEVELSIARAGVVAEAAARGGLAEDVTARARDRTVRLLGDRVVPGHVRALSTNRAINVEADVTGRLAVRGAVGGVDAAGEVVAAAAGGAGVSLDAAQERAVAALAGDHPLVVVSGAAGAGKTSMLAAARAAIEAGGHRLVVVAPTLRAARAARAETGAQASSAAKLAWAYGWRWDAAGVWRRLAVGATDPDRGDGAVFAGPAEGTRLASGDLLVVDEAGMCGQDTARALLHIADETGARLVLVGDARQLAAVGRGGVLGIAARHTGRQVDLDVVHRFTRTAEIVPGVVADVPDREYADLSLAMRGGRDPGGVFDRLVAGGHIHLHHDIEGLHRHLAAEVVQARGEGRRITVAADTREQVAVLNGVVRQAMVDAGLVDDTVTVAGAAGQVVGVGDVVATRRNDRGLGVANRDLWSVTAVTGDGGVTVVPAGGPRHGRATVGDTRALPADYVQSHVELAYASTVHGVQGDTAGGGHLVLSEGTSAAAAYVGMTRGRSANTCHVIADSLDDARSQWVAAAGRDRADTGVEAARAAAEQQAARYAGVAVSADPGGQERVLAGVLDGLRAAWDTRADAQTALDQLAPRIGQARAAVAARQAWQEQVVPLRAAAERARQAAATAATAAEQARQVLDERAERIDRDLARAWRRYLPTAVEAIDQVTAGPGRLGPVTGRRRDFHDAHRWLRQWADAWRPVLPDLPTPGPDGDPAGWAGLLAAHTRSAAGQVDAAISDHAARAAAAESPHLVAAITAGQAAAEAARAAAAAQHRAETTGPAAGSGRYVTDRDPAETLTRLTRKADTATAVLADAERTITTLTGDPAVAALPDPDRWIETAHHEWAAGREATHTAARAAEAAAARRPVRAAARYPRYPRPDVTATRDHDYPPRRAPDRGPGIGF